MNIQEYLICEAKERERESERARDTESGIKRSRKEEERIRS